MAGIQTQQSRVRFRGLRPAVDLHGEGRRPALLQASAGALPARGRRHRSRRLETTYHDLVAFKAAAEQGYASSRKGDNFIAEGRRAPVTTSATASVRRRRVRRQPHRPRPGAHPLRSGPHARDRRRPGERAPASRTTERPSARTPGHRTVKGGDHERGRLTPDDDPSPTRSTDSPGRPRDARTARAAAPDQLEPAVGHDLEAELLELNRWVDWLRHTYGLPPA
jgi:hypothetical protein